MKPIQPTMIEEELNNEQQYAASFAGKHLLVLAGAGSGKTKTIIARAKHLIKSGVDESRIRIVSFTNKSADEIVARINSELGDLSQGRLCGQTFHSWCFNIIKEHPEFFAQANSTLITPNELEDCIGYLRGIYIPDTARCPTNSEIVSIYSRAVNTRVSLTQAMRCILLNRDDPGTPEENDDPIFVEKKEMTAKLISEFIKYKEEHNLIDYDDMLDIVAQTMQIDEEARLAISGTVDHILVDETQDTNRLQYEVLINFADQSHLFCVGDDAQSIYAFRGADFESIHGFTQLVKDAEVCRLETNYRSTQPILDLSNWLLDQSPLNYDKRLKSHRGQGIKPEIINFTKKGESEEDIILKIIKSIHNGERYSDQLILVRKNYELDDIKRKCTAKKIPYQVFGGIELMQSAHIIDLLSTFRIVSNYRNAIPWTRYIKCFRGIGDATASRVINKVLETESLNDALNVIKTLDLPTDVVCALAGVQAHEDSPAQAIDVAFNAMRSALQLKYDRSWLYRKEDFPALRELASSSANIQLFVEEYLMNEKILTANMEPDDGPRDLVTLSTIHSAKGLEASNVYVLNVTNGNWPDPRSAASLAATEEERRCLYVALTRAKNRLYIYRKLNSKNFNDNNILPPAYFLNELPKELVNEMTIHKDGIISSVGSNPPVTPRNRVGSRFNFN